MKQERYAIGLILVALLSGMVLTAATSGCQAPNDNSISASNPSATLVEQPI